MMRAYSTALVLPRLHWLSGSWLTAFYCTGGVLRLGAPATVQSIPQFTVLYSSIRKNTPQKDLTSYILGARSTSTTFYSLAAQARVLGAVYWVLFGTHKSQYLTLWSPAKRYYTIGAFGPSHRDSISTGTIR